MRGTAIYEDGSIEARFSATGHYDDYGVPRSPTWIAWEDVEIEDLTILGVEIKDPKVLPLALVNAILALADECDFEVDE